MLVTLSTLAPSACSVVPSAGRSLSSATRRPRLLPAGITGMIPESGPELAMGLHQLEAESVVTVAVGVASCRRCDWRTVKGSARWPDRHEGRLAFLSLPDGRLLVEKTVTSNSGLKQ